MLLFKISLKWVSTQARDLNLGLDPLFAYLCRSVKVRFVTLLSLLKQFTPHKSSIKKSLRPGLSIKSRGHHLQFPRTDIMEQCSVCLLKFLKVVYRFQSLTLMYCIVLGLLFSLHSHSKTCFYNKLRKLSEIFKKMLLT